MELRKSFRELSRKKEAEMNQFEKEVRNLRIEKQIWRIVNREKKNINLIDENIHMKEWENIFLNYSRDIGNIGKVEESREKRKEIIIREKD